jgi:hypothetical protein
MGKKIKITEEQLKRLIEKKQIDERLHSYVGETNEEEKTDVEQIEDKDKEEVEVEESPINESIKNIRKEFNRFL